MGNTNKRRRWVRTRLVRPARLHIGGTDYSVYHPGKVRQGLRLWAKEALRTHDEG